MSPQSAHLGEALQDLLDRRLAPAAQAEAEAHLSACDDCRRELEALRAVKEALGRHVGTEPVPAHLASALAAALDRDEAAAVARPRRWPSLRPAMALGLLAVATLAVGTALWRARSPSALPDAVARAHSDYRDGRLALEFRTTDPAELERFFAARGAPVPARVYDLGMMGFRLVGGRLNALDGRAGILFAYEGPDGIALLCDMYRGRLSELPEPEAVRENQGIRFHVHRRDGLTMVFWEEGDVVCVLASELPAEDVVRLAFAKAMAPPPRTGT